MFSQIAGIALAGVLLGGGGHGVSLTGSPAAIDHAKAHHSYVVMATNSGKVPLRITAALSQATAAAGGCHIALDKAVPPSWAVLSGPHHFTILPGHWARLVVKVRRPPPGRSELIASFIAAADPSGGQVATRAGVGTALRFSEPGTAAVAPCPRHVVAAKPSSGGGRSVPWLTYVLLGLAGGVALIGAGALALRLRRRASMAAHAGGRHGR